MPMQFKIFTFLIILIFSPGCSANSSDNIKEIEAVKRKLAEILPNEINLISIQETDLNGFFEVNFEGIEPLYVSSDGNYLVSGDIYLITKDGLVNKSEARRDYQRKTLIKGLNESELITFEPRQINHNIFVFTDVDCGYCRQFHNQINEYLELGIRVNYLAYP